MTTYRSFVARVEVFIELGGICNTLAAIAQALENIEQEQIEDNPDFENTQHYKNLEHQKLIIEYAMSAVDLDTRYGSAEARKVAMERFDDNVEKKEWNQVNK